MFVYISKNEKTAKNHLKYGFEENVIDSILKNSQNHS